MSSDTNKLTYISHLEPKMNNINVNFIVLEIGTPRRTSQGQGVRTVKVADPTGSINVSVWNELGDFLRSGDICRLRNGFTNVYRGSLGLSCGKMGELVKTGEFFMTYAESPNMSEFSSDLAQKFPNKRTSPEKDSGSSGSNRSNSVASQQHDKSGKRISNETHSGGGNHHRANSAAFNSNRIAHNVKTSKDEQPPPKMTKYFSSSTFQVNGVKS